MIRSKARKVNPLRLELEQLEERCLLAVIPVANIDQLRAAIASAANQDIIECAGGGYFSPQPARGAPVMLCLAGRHEISQMPQFHSDTLSRLV